MRYMTFVKSKVDNYCERTRLPRHCLDSILLNNHYINHATATIILMFYCINCSVGHDPEKEAVTCPVPYGGALLFSNLTPHRR